MKSLVEDVRSTAERRYHAAPLWVKDAGLGWYGAAHDLARELAKRLDGRERIVRMAGILAVLSPQISWSSTIAAAKQVVDGSYYGSFYGAFRRNVVKAEKIRDNVDGWERLISGRKVSAFADNIAYPEWSTRVTIDRIMCRLLDVEPKRLGCKGVYAKVSLGVMFAAASVNVLPHQMQAALWVDERGSEE